MTELLSYLTRWGDRIWRASSIRTFGWALASSLLYLWIYLMMVMFIDRLPLSWLAAAWLPAIAMGWAAWRMLSLRLRLKKPREVARIIENQNPDLDLKIRSAMDLHEQRSDHVNNEIAEVYVARITHEVAITPPVTDSWARPIWLSVVMFAMVTVVWSLWGNQLMRKLTQPLIAFSDTQIVFENGSITIFEPDYTNIPGRTLPLKTGKFHAYPGSRVRFTIQDSRPLQKVWISTSDEPDLVVLSSETPGQFTYEFLLLKALEVTFFLDDQSRGGQTQPFAFETKRDTEPEIQIKSHTPEGAINALDPLYLDAMVKDDFGVAKLEAVVAWEGDEKRLPLQVPNNQRTQFVSKNRWSISDLVPDNAVAFSIHLEASDNNPINGPGVGQSEMLHFELESPERKHDELVDLARQLLIRMTNVLGDNLDTILASANDRLRIAQAHGVSEEIQSGLFQAQSLTNTIMALMREDPFITTLDYEFVRDFNNDLTRAFRQRIEMGQLYASVSRQARPSLVANDLNRLHGQEELRLEKLTYDLLMQLKMWALMDMERSQEAIEQALENLEKMLENGENMDQEQLEQLLEEMLNEVMKELQKMFAKAAQEMDQTLDEFMNQEGMEFQQDQMEELKQEMLEAMKNGDMEKLKELMEQFKEMMSAAMSGMQKAMGEMSPQMQQMMQDMREMMGLLNELKQREEDLQSQTQQLKADIDEEMGGNPSELSDSEKQEQKDAMARIRELLTTLHENLVNYQNEETSKRIIAQITQLKTQLDREDLSEIERRQIESRVHNAERTLDYIMRDSMDQLQDITLKSLDTAERMSDMLQQGELTQSLDVGFQLENKLLQGERFSERGVSEDIQNEARPKETFQESREELYKILEALQNLKQNMENKRREHMAESGDQRQQKLAKEQDSVRKMIDDFEQRVQDSLGGSQMMERMEQIGLSMKNAERKLKGSNLDGGLYHEQEALRQIGEMMEQMQQSMKPGQMRPQFMPGMNGRQESLYGDPTGDVYIPESERALRDDQLKDLIRRQLQKNFPDSFGKEIKQYYETLMDQ